MNYLRIMLIGLLTGMLSFRVSADKSSSSLSLFDRYLPTNGIAKDFPVKRMLSSHARAFGNSGPRRIGLPAATTSPHATVIYGSLLDQDNPGMYSYDLTTNTFSPIEITPELFANGNGFVVDNTYYCFYMDVYGSYASVVVYKFDVNTWQSTGTGYANYTDTPIDLATDPVSGYVYGCFPGENIYGTDKYVWAQYNPKSYTRVAISELDVPFLAVAADASGQYYGIDPAANLYKINKHTGEKTLVGSTGLSLSENPQSATFDLTYGHMYLAAELADAETGLYTIDTSTGRATLVNSFPDAELMMGIFVPVPETSFTAPGAVTEIVTQFEQDSTSGKLIFKMPANTYGGSPLSGEIDYAVKCDGMIIATGKAAPCAEVSLNVSTTPGYHTYEAYAFIGSENGPSAKNTLYVGPDTPKGVEDLFAESDKEGNVTIRWEAPDESQNGGWFDRSALKYKVVRVTDNYVVEESTSATSVTDHITAEELKNWQYAVTPYVGELEGPRALSNIVSTGSYANIPWESDFSTDDTWGLYTVINVHNDGYTWEHGGWRECAMVDYDFTNPKDDWLITPPLRLESNHTYKLEFKTRTKRVLPEKLEVKMGTANTIEGMTETIMEPTTITTEEEIIDIERVHEFYVAVPEDGNYYFGFHAMSEPHMNRIEIPYIKVTDAGNSLSPEAPADLVVVPGVKGALEAEVSFTAPAKSIIGKPLNSLEKAEIYVNGDLAATIENPAPGVTVTKTVATAQGDNEIRVKAYNEAGYGLEAVATVYTGVVKPAMVTNLHAQLDGEAVKITWTAPTEGEDGGYVDPDALEYMIMRNDQTVLATAHKGTEFIDYLENFKVDGQGIVSYIVIARNPAGSSWGQSSNGIVLGTATYQLPFVESFPTGLTSNTPWGITSDTETSWWITRDGTNVKAYDNDNGQAMFVPKGPGESSMIYTGRFNLNSTLNPSFSLMYYNDNQSENEIEVLWTDNYADFHSLGVAKFLNSGKDEGWNELKIDLKDLKDKPMVAFGIKGITGADNWQYTQYIDLIRVFDDLDYNLEMRQFNAPGNITLGNEGVFSGYITNIGNLKASDYTIDLYCNDELVKSVTGNEIEPGESFTYTIAYAPRHDQTPTADFKAVINWDKDQNPENNALPVRKVIISTHDFPTVTDLSGTIDDSGNIILNWSAPAPATTPAVTTESFEDYTAFIISEIGDWTLIDVDGESGTLGITYGGNPVKYMNVTYPHAYQVFNPEKCGMDEKSIGMDVLMPHSGNQYLVSFQDTDGLCDDWLISPELSGYAQTVSFFVKSPIPNHGFETYEVYYSTTDKNIESFKKIEGLKEDAFRNWEEVAVTLPAGAKYFAIRHTSEGKLLLAIDDISYIAKDAPDEPLKITGYTIYRDNEKLTTLPAAATSFTDTAAGSEQHTYAVTVNYEQGESPYSNLISIVSGIDSLSCVSKAIGLKGALEVYNATGCKVHIATVDGKTVATCRATSALERIYLPAGIYIVSINDITVKVIVR